MNATILIKNRWLLSLIFVVVLLVNYLSSAGIFLSNTQQEISDKYINLLAPIGFTFSIWGVIYAGMAVTIFYELKKQMDEHYLEIYSMQIKPLFAQWMVLNVLWIISWSEEWLLLSFILIAAYARTLLKLMKIISQNKLLRSKNWILKYPVGLHTGWIVFATFANLTTYAVSIGIDGTGKFAVWWTMILMIIAVGVGVYLYAMYGNEALMLPIIWGIFGIAIKHQNSVNFLYANSIICYMAWLLVFIAIGLYLYLTYLKGK